jgi:GNAT superfamily N-acetyltransferase
MTSTNPEAYIRRARPEEADALTALIRRAKAHWGYDQSFLEMSRPFLQITAATIERDPVYCAQVTGTVAGLSHLQSLNATEVQLAELFVDPTFIGHGIGGQLWRHAIEQVRTMGAQSLTFEADPHAQPFYEHVGAIVEGYNPSPVLVGREIPRMRYTL